MDIGHIQDDGINSTIRSEHNDMMVQSLKNTV